MRKKYDPTLKFQTITEAARTTGLSQYSLRRGTKDGSVPHVKSGNRTLINIPLLLEYMDRQSVNNVPLMLQRLSEQSAGSVQTKV